MSILPQILKGAFRLEAGSLVGVLAVFALVAVNGFFVAAEFGLVRMRQTRIDELLPPRSSALSWQVLRWARLVSLPVTHCRLRVERVE
jgi:CBS domain containing-hemolysin-like protein